MMYLYSFEDGTIQQSKTKPTNVDLQCMADGILQVFGTTGTLFELNDQGKAEEIQHCEIVGKVGQSYHQPTSS